MPKLFRIVLVPAGYLLWMAVFALLLLVGLIRRLLGRDA